VQANILRLRALKTFQMGWFYYKQLLKHTPALALLEHSTVLCRRAQEEIAACDEDMPRANDYLNELEGLPLRSAMGAIHATMAALQKCQHTRRLKNAGADSSAALQQTISTDRPLLLSLYDLDGGTSNALIADLRPMPLPPKPVFYDLAYDCALYPSISIDAVEEFYHAQTVAPLVDEEKKDKSASSCGILDGRRGANRTRSHLALCFKLSQ
jgi:hypothetical protein